MTLDELRRHLNGLDRRLLELIAERQRTGREIARVKRSTGQPTRDYGRERDVILAARANAPRARRAGRRGRGAHAPADPLLADDAGAGQRRGAGRRRRPAGAGDRRRRQDRRLVRAVPGLAGLRRSRSPTRAGPAGRRHIADWRSSARCSTTSSSSPRRWARPTDPARAGARAAARRGLRRRLAEDAAARRPRGAARRRRARSRPSTRCSARTPSCSPGAT